MKNSKIQKIVLTALLAAMTFIGTVIIKIPSPPTGGYIHPGDSIVIISGILLGPIYGFLAASIGSMLADMYSGYMGFMLATLIIKGLAALVSSFTYHFCIKALKGKFQPLTLGITSVFAGIVVTVGYFLFEAFIMELGVPAALAGVPFNLIQNAFGLLVVIIVFPMVKKRV
jgi:uncharacterized membrane protein